MTISLILNIILSAGVLPALSGPLVWSIATQDRDLPSAAADTSNGVVTDTRRAPRATPVAVPM
jgi:hypothetical protein